MTDHICRLQLLYHSPLRSFLTFGEGKQIKQYGYIPPGKFPASIGNYYERHNADRGNDESLYSQWCRTAARGHTGGEDIMF